MNSARYLRRCRAAVRLIQNSVAAVAVLTVAQIAAYAQTNLVANGGFENGTDGWMWEQWANKPLPGVVDKGDHSEGEASFKMGVAGATGSRWLAKEIPVKEQGRDHVLSFALKPTAMDDHAARVRLAIPDKGFLNGGDLVRTGGTKGWTTYSYTVPGDILKAASKATLFIYDDAMGTGTLGIDAVSFQTGTAPAPAALTGETSRPDDSTYALGETVRLTFRAEHIARAQAPSSLNVQIADEHDTVLTTKSVPVSPDATGSATATVDLSADRFGFYRVRAALPTGETLSAVGSRPEGMLTYIVTPSPAKRIDYGEFGSRFGMQGGFGPWGDHVLAALGARWVLDNALEWKRQEPHHTGEFIEQAAQKYIATPNSSTWHEYTLPTLFDIPEWAAVPGTSAYMTGTLTKQGETAWESYCKVAAAAYAAHNPDRKQHVYQITWEPISPWGFKGTDADLLRIYEIASQSIHATDPSALVCGPTCGINENGPQQQLGMFKLGIGKQMDGYTVHPYYSITPEKDGMVEQVRAVSTLLDKYAKPNMPLFGTEQGWSTGEDESKELLQAQGLMRQNLIMLGEGYRFNMAFYIADYRITGQKGYGYYYNLDPSVPFGPQRVSPKPIAAAYAAQSFLLDGSSSAGTIEWLGDGIHGYAFDRGSQTTLAVWSDRDKAVSVNVPVGNSDAVVYDWMGNRVASPISHGQLAVTASAEPVYIVGVSQSMWGAKAVPLLSQVRTPATVFPGQPISVFAIARSVGDIASKYTVVIDWPSSWNLPAGLQDAAVRDSKGTSVSISGTVPGAVRPSSYTGRLRLLDSSGQLAYAAAVKWTVTAPVSVTAEQGRGDDGKPYAKVVLTDCQGMAAEGVVKFRLKAVLPAGLRSDLPMIDLVADPAKTVDVLDSAQDLPFHLSAKGSTTLDFDLSKAPIEGKLTYQAVISLSLANGVSYSTVVPLDFLAAMPARKIDVDGNLAEWQAEPSARLSASSDIVRTPQEMPSSFAAQLRYAWSDTALYIGADVADDVFIQPYSGADTWKADCLQLAFNMDPDIDNASDRIGARRTCEINVALTPKGPEATRMLASLPSIMPLGLLTPNMATVAVQQAKGHLAYEIALPWTTLGYAPGQHPVAGSRIGVAATVNEVHRSDQNDPAALGLFGGITPSKDPGKFGTLLLK